MFTVIGIMFAGIAMGYLLRKIELLQKIGKPISYTIFLLLFLLGISVGANKDIVDNLATLGGQAFLLAVASTGAWQLGAVTGGVPIQNMQEFLGMPSGKQDRLMKDYGIPTDSTDNQFKLWVQHAREVNRNLVIAIKADQDTPYPKIKNIMNTLQDLRENRYNLITSLKKMPDNV